MPPDDKLKVALAVVRGLKTDITRGCIVLSLAVRDFLRDLGFDAQVRTVVLQFIAKEQGEWLPALTVGGRWFRGEHPYPGGWDGHMVATLPGEGLLIDPSLGEYRRPAWNWIPDIVITPLLKAHELVPLAGRKFRVLAAIEQQAGDETLSGAMWLAHKNDKWRGSPSTARERRTPIVTALSEAFKERTEQTDPTQR
jgi:hypothetical protein